MNPSLRLPMILRKLDSSVEMRINRQFVEQLGFSLEEIQQREFLDWIHPEDHAALNSVIETGQGKCVARHRSNFGDWVPFEWTVDLDDRTVVLLGLSAHESQALRDPTVEPTGDGQNSLATTLETMVRIVESKNPGLRCSILLLDDTRQAVSVGAGPSFPPEYNQAVEGLRIGPFVGSCGTAAYWNTPIVVENIYEDPLWKDLRDAAKFAGVSACWSQPIAASSGDVLGAMALYSDTPSAPAQFQMDGLEVAARMVGLAIERDRLEERLKVAVNVEALAVLSGGIAHDFNNILSSILGNTQLISATLDEPSDVRDMLNEIEKSSLRATELCDQMLTYAGRGHFDAETIDCNEVIRELSKLTTSLLPGKTRLTCELDESPLGIHADKAQIQQLMMNLINNATEALGSKEGEISISTSVRDYSGEELQQDHPEAKLDAGPYVLVSVADTGGGMPASAIRRAFDPFFTTKPSSRGLGLTAVQGIVQKHNGAIDLKVEPGVGSTLSVLLPQVPIFDEPVSEELPSRQRDQGARILIVDDEDAVRTVLSRMLQHAEYETVLARNGSEAIDLYRYEWSSIDCVILDLSMPSLDGWDVYFELLKINPDVRVILSSGFTEQQIMIRFNNAGLAGILKKPTTMADLLGKVAEVLS